MKLSFGRWVIALIVCAGLLYGVDQFVTHRAFWFLFSGAVIGQAVMFLLTPKLHRGEEGRPKARTTAAKLLSYTHEAHKSCVR
jgi:hypothetical protein